MDREPEKGKPQKERQGAFAPWNSWQENSFRIWVLRAVLLLFMAWSMYASRGGLERIDYTTFLTQVNAGDVAQVTVKGDKITGRLRQKAYQQAGFVLCQWPTLRMPLAASTRISTSMQASVA